ncbi:MAG: four helix bundle protein [Bacteroidota bacterium]
MNDRPHKKLRAWQKSMNMVERVYEVTQRFPGNEEFGLKSQLRRASVSVPSNIAEGMTRRSKNEKVYFLGISQSSLSEIDTQLEIALRLKYLTLSDYESMERILMEIQMLVSGLSRKYLER